MVKEHRFIPYFIIFSASALTLQGALYNNSS